MAGLFLCVATSTSTAQLELLQQTDSKPQPLPMEQAFNYYVSELGENHLRITWEPAAEHYLYHHGFNFSLDTDPPDQSSVQFELPEGLAKTDQFFGDVEVYYDLLHIDLYLPPDHVGKTLLLEYQGCADWGFCYPPQQTEYPLLPR
ncbi:MAG: protein-disulfide reductase DsbD domain-containing protein [Pseudohongiellaceae bacterium]